MAAVVTLHRVLASRRTSRRWATLAQVVAVAVAATVILLAVAAYAVIDGRGSRSAWRTTQPHLSGPVHGSMISETEFVNGRRVDRVLYAALDSSAPVPPGVSRQVRPGERFVSPALAAAARRDPVTFARYVNPTGILGSAALAEDRELVSLEGVAADDPRMDHDHLVTSLGLGPYTLRHFLTSASDAPLYGDYLPLTGLGVVLLAVPAFGVLVAVAFLVSSQRTHERGVLRLLGLGSGPTTWLAVGDVAVPAVLGVLLAQVPTSLLLWWASRLSVAGVPFGPTLSLPASTRLVVAVAVVATVAAASAWSVRRLTSDPLGTVRRSAAHRVRGWRIVGLVAAAGWFLQVGRQDHLAAWQIMTMWSALLVGIALVGPLIVQTVGWCWWRRAVRPTGLLAARRMMDSPAAVYRQVGALSTVMFICGALVVAGSLRSAPSADRTTVQVEFSGLADQAAAQRAVAAVRPLAERVELREHMDRANESAQVTLRRPSDFESIRLAVQAHDPDARLFTWADVARSRATMFADFAQAADLLLAATVLSAALGIAAFAVGTVIEQRVPLTALRMVGVGLGTLRSAQTRVMVVPVALAAGGSAVLAAWLTSVAAQVPVPDGGWVRIGWQSALTVVVAWLAVRSVAPFLDRCTRDRRVLGS